MMAFWVKQGWYTHGKRGGSDVPFGLVRFWGEKDGWGEVHVAAAIYVIWGAMMVSKTLKVGFLSLDLVQGKLLIDIAV